MVDHPSPACRLLAILEVATEHSHRSLLLWTAVAQHQMSTEHTDQDLMDDRLKDPAIPPTEFLRDDKVARYEIF